MCGVAFLFNAHGIRPADHMVAMLDAIAHRGPDDSGVKRFGPSAGASMAWSPYADEPAAGRGLDPTVVLGHRRLSILDVSAAGHQPMPTSDGKLWISYNGEIYNSPELRRELEAKGVRFRSRTDTEVMLELYRVEGDRFVERLNGIFAFALLDLNRNRLLLGRDRMGVKPLYLAQSGQSWIGASEVKAIVASKLVRPAIDPCGLMEYLTFQNLLGRRTLFTGIQLLPPGHLFELNADGRDRMWPFWKLRFHATVTDRKVAAEGLRGALESAVDRQLLSDVPVGTYLSGGMDSGTITALAAKRLPRIPTFTAGFSVRASTGREAHFDERADAEAMAEAFGAEIFEVVVQPRDLIEFLPKVIHHLEDPRVGMCYPGYMVARLASRFVKVGLSGVGGDELFGGYPWRYRAARTAASDDALANEVYAYWCRLLPDQERPRFLSAPFLNSCGGYNPRNAFQERWEEAGQSVDPELPRLERRIQHLLAYEISTFLPGLLMVEDKVNMAHSLEARVPLLDNQVVDFALSLSPRLLLSEDFLQGRPQTPRDENLSGKRIMRKALSGLLPDYILQKPKQGFSAPEETWYRESLKDYAGTVISALETGPAPLLVPGSAHEVMAEHVSGKNRRLLIWSLLYLARLEDGLGMKLERPWLDRGKQLVV